ncbi:MAG: aspartate dehydrogenase [Candidatus Hadarchaeales archaeon]
MEGVHIRIAIIGCGAIGTLLAKAVDSGVIGGVRLSWLYDIVPEKSDALAKKLRKKPKIANTAGDIYSDRNLDLVVEAASQEAVRQYSLDVLKSGKNLMVMSVGAFSDEKLLSRVRKMADAKGRRVYIPSGAILGIDGIKASQIGGIEKVLLVTRKPPSALAYSDYLKSRRISVKGLKSPKIVFEGPAREAVKAFPASVNVAATLSLAGIGFDRTRVRVVADPTISRNVHEIWVRGKFGSLFTQAHNLPFPESRRTSYLAALSAIRTLKNIGESIRVGT